MDTNKPNHQDNTGKPNRFGTISIHFPSIFSFFSLTKLLHLLKTHSENCNYQTTQSNKVVSNPNALSDVPIAANKHSSPISGPFDFPELQNKFTVLEKARMKEPEKHVWDFFLNFSSEKQIGEGTFSSVYLASPVNNPRQQYALKRINSTCSRE